MGSGFTGYNRKVYCVAVQNDGKILVGGIFSSFNGISRNSIARLNTDGTLDTTFDAQTNPNGTIYSLTVQNDGKILVGGYFTSINGTSRKSIARLNTDGTLDTTFDPGAGFNGTVYSIEIQGDGKVLAGGFFSSYNGISRNNIVCLNTDGTLDAIFDSGSGFNNRVTSIALQNDGKILVGGFFTSFNGLTQNRIIRLNADGNYDNSFDTGVGFNANIFTIAIQSNEKIIAGGVFDSYNGTPENMLSRLHTDGTLDNSFDTGTGFDDAVFALAIQSDNKIITGGYFTSYNGIGRNRIARLLGGCVDVSLSTHWSTITANNTNATYQWIDCNNNNAIIPNENSQNFTATQDGDYAVIVSSTENFCIDTSACINITSASLEESFNDNRLRLYPNPNNGSFTVETSDPIKVEVFNSLGRKVDFQNLEAGKNQFCIQNIGNGLYYLHATDEFGDRISQRVIIVE